MRVLGSKTRNNHKLNRYMTSGRNSTQVTLVGGEGSHSYTPSVLTLDTKYKLYGHSTLSTWCPYQRGSFIMRSNPSTRSTTNSLLPRFPLRPLGKKNFVWCRYGELPEQSAGQYAYTICGLSIAIYISINSCKLCTRYIFVNSVKQS